METSTFPFPLTGVVPAVCDAEAGGFSDWQVRSARAKLCSAVRSARDDESGIETKAKLTSMPHIDRSSHCGSRVEHQRVRDRRR
jgi:hypothetical protein